MKILLHPIGMVLCLTAVLLCPVPVQGKVSRGLQVLSIEGRILDSAGRPVEEYDYLEPGRNYRLLPEAKVLLSTLDGKKTYQAVGPGAVFFESPDLVLLNGKTLKPKEQHSLLQDVTAGKPPRLRISGITAAAPSGRPGSGKALLHT